VPYTAETEAADNNQATYVNYIGENLSVANYIDPSVKVSDDQTKIVTVSRFAPGVCPECLFGVPTIWWTDEDVVTTLGTYLAKFRKESQQFQKDFPEVYETFPMWDTFQDGWQKQFTPITIPDTPENFGIIHSDLHTGNWMIDAKHEQNMDLFDITVIDFDNAQRAWYMIDLGTVVFELNKTVYSAIYDAVGKDAYEAWFYQFKNWIVDAYSTEYGSSVDENELFQGCQWRKDFLYYLYQGVLPYVPENERQDLQDYIDLYDQGLMPTC